MTIETTETTETTDQNSARQSSAKVLVAGATGGVGQLVVARLLDQGYAVRALTRNAEKAKGMFGDVPDNLPSEGVEIAVGDTRKPETLPAAFEGITHVICATGTTAFPSARWQFEFGDDPEWLGWPRILVDADYRKAKAKNDPEQVDGIAIEHLVAAAPQTLQRFVFVSSCGVDRKSQPPYNLLNAFGVLDAKARGEAAIRHSGLPYTILRPGQLIDGPFTSYDLNTLLKATTDGNRGIKLGTGDRLNGQTSRIDVADACVACLADERTRNLVFEIVNGGDRPETIDWPNLFGTVI